MTPVTHIKIELCYNKLERKAIINIVINVSNDSLKMVTHSVETTDNYNLNPGPRKLSFSSLLFWFTITVS